MTSDTPTPEIPVILTTCGGKIEDPSKYPAAEFRGKLVYFCTEACRQAFFSDPAGFMAGEVEHPE